MNRMLKSFAIVLLALLCVAGMAFAGGGGGEKGEGIGEEQITIAYTGYPGGLTAFWAQMAQYMKEEADALGAELGEEFPTGSYHAGKTTQARDHVQEAFLTGEVEAMDVVGHVVYLTITLDATQSVRLETHIEQIDGRGISPGVSVDLTWATNRATVVRDDR